MFRTVNSRLNSSAPHSNSIKFPNSIPLSMNSTYKYKANSIQVDKEYEMPTKQVSMTKPLTTEVIKSQQKDKQASLDCQAAKQSINKEFYMDWKIRNSNRLLLSNNQLSSKKEKNYHFRPNNEQEQSMVATDMGKNIFRVHNHRKTAFIQSIHNNNNANSINVMATEESEMGSDNTRYGNMSATKEKASFSGCFLNKEKIEKMPTLYQNRQQLFVQRKEAERKLNLFSQPNLIRDLQTEKMDFACIAPGLHKKRSDVVEVEYFGESYKGRRPYNEDRYICEIKRSNTNDKSIKLIGNQGKIEQNSDAKKTEISINWMLGVFDGHGGSKCAEYLKDNFYSMLSTHKTFYNNPILSIQETVDKAQEKFLDICEKSNRLETSGSCAVVCLIRPESIYIGNVGDCRALFLGLAEFRQITKDHKPDDPNEKNRIIRNGGKLYKDGSMMGLAGKENIKVFHQTRILPGSLNVSRTIGDIEVKVKKFGGSPGIVIHDPELHVQSLTNNFEHLILASDGLFEGLSNKEIHEIYKNERKSEKDGFCKQFVKQLIKKSGEKSTDNITVVCIRLPTTED